MEQKNKRRARAVFFIALFVFIVCIAVLIWCVLHRNTAQQDYSEYTSPVTEAESAETEETEEATELEDNPINFDELIAVNPDVYAWIRIPNTNIDYPVAQSSSDDSFYLSHNINKEYEFAGMIYTEMKNSKDFTDPNTVLYGHNMLDGSMFQNLHLFRDEEFFDENPYIYIYTPGHILTYEIFSAYRYDNRHILNSFDFSDKEVFAEYLEFALNPKSLIVNVRSGVDVTVEDKIITLSTCIGDSNYRYLVQGVLTDDQPTK